MSVSTNTAAPPPARRPLRVRLRKSVGRFTRRQQDALERWVSSKSLIDTTEIIPSASFPWVAELETNWQAIRRELETVLVDRAALPNMQDLSELQYTIVKEKVWKVFAFRAYGTRIEENCRRCPETSKLLDRIPELEVAFFSVLEPGAHLNAHRGAYKGLVRAHLGLIVPEPHENCRMQVGNETIYWQEGKCVLFDDTYRHEVWNDTDGVRVVLLIDVPRPFPQPLATINKAALRAFRFTPFITGAVGKLKAWEKQFYGTTPR